MIKNKKKILNDKTLLVTADIGKSFNMGYYRLPNGKDIKPFQFFNNGYGFNKIYQTIVEVLKKHKLNNIVFGFESTACYAEPLIHFLSKRSIILVQVNPMHTKKVKELQDNSPNKTDKKDPKVIADIIELGRYLTVIIPKGITAELRRLAYARERSLERRTRLWNQLQELLFVIFPEFTQIMKGIKTKTSQFLLKNYPSPQDIIELGLDKLQVLIRKLSRGRISQEKATNLFETASMSVGIKEGSQSIAFELKEILKLIECANKYIEELEDKMANYVDELPYSKYILSIKGIGKISVAVIIGEIGDFNNFSTIKEITKLAGLNLSEKSSGKFQGQRKISKRGRTLLRKFLYFAALNTSKKGGVLHDIYEKHLEKGKLKMKALVAIMRKLLGIIFALVRDQKDFCNNYSN